jgi:hypothetical protein
MFGLKTWRIHLANCWQQGGEAMQLLYMKREIGGLGGGGGTGRVNCGNWQISVICLKGLGHLIEFKYCDKS